MGKTKLNDGFGVGPWIQHIGRYIEAPPIKLAPAKNARNRFMVDAAAQQRRELPGDAIISEYIRRRNQLAMANAGGLL